MPHLIVSYKRERYVIWCMKYTLFILIKCVPSYILSYNTIKENKICIYSSFSWCLILFQTLVLLLEGGSYHSGYYELDFYIYLKLDGKNKDFVHLYVYNSPSKCIIHKNFKLNNNIKRYTYI